MFSQNAALAGGNAESSHRKSLRIFGLFRNFSEPADEALLLT